MLAFESINLEGRREIKVAADEKVSRAQLLQACPRPVHRQGFHLRVQLQKCVIEDAGRE